MSEPRDDVTVLRASSRSNSRPDSHEPVTPRVLKSRFVLDEKLGSGGMGTVYRAKDLRKVEARDRFPYVAIKVLNSDVREHPEAFIALEREAAKSQSLSHPNIVSIFDFDKDGNVPFLTMELLQGRELADLLHAYPNGLPEALGLDVIRGLCAGLRYAHENGVVHADFKPGNVFVTTQDVAKILDFGIARAVQVRPDHGEDTVFDPARMAALTPVYASLEMIRGDNPEPRDDIYALAVVIYMILTGHHPYGRLAANEALAEGLVPERPKNLGRRQWRALSSALSFYRQNRPASVAELEQAFFGRVAWRSRAVAAAGMLVAVFAGSFAAIEGAQIDEVKEEVRQTTLVDAQAARVSGYMMEGALTPTAIQALQSEMMRLKAIDATGSYYPALEAQMVERAQNAMRQSSSWTDTVALYEVIQSFGGTEIASGLLQAALQRTFDEQARSLIAGGSDGAAAVATLLELQKTVLEVAPQFELSADLAALGQVLGDQAIELARAGDLETANALLAAAEPLAPQAERLATLHALAEAESARALKAQEQARIDQLLAGAERALGGSCLRLDLDALAPPKVRAVRHFVDQRLHRCVVDLQRVDIEQARHLQRTALDRFGRLPRVSSVNLDPCSQALSCRDGEVGPDLVVVSAEDSGARVAVSQEISGADLAAFCRATGLACGSDADPFPSTGLDAETIESYAEWLSQETGYRYRLPGLAEWRALGSDAASVTVNCGGGLLRSKKLARSTAGEANSHGLHHLVGNASELVKEGDAYWVVGGSVQDNGACALDLKVPWADSDTKTVGFRLLRELT